MKTLPDVLIGLSIIAVLLTIIGMFTNHLWLAGTQWMEIAIVLSAWAIYLKIRD